MRYDTYTGGEHYWIAFSRGTHVVYREGWNDNEVVFAGHYDQCLKWIQDQIVLNYEYDNDL